MPKLHDRLVTGALTVTLALVSGCDAGALDAPPQADASERAFLGFLFPKPKPKPKPEPVTPALPEPRLQPRLPDLSGVVVDEDWARVLGKALFWDIQVGSDGIACASCHYSGGADARITNALSPGLAQLPEPDAAFGAIAPEHELGRSGSGGRPGPNYTLQRGDFPFHQLEDPDDRNSPILITTNDRASSAGAFPATFVRARSGLLAALGDQCHTEPSEVFQLDGLVTRQVEPRHTPSVINAVFNHRNFWDGRANNAFNGVDPFGPRAWVDPRNGVIVHGGGNRFHLEQLALPDASLASQAVGPPLSELEMSCAGRTFPDIGRRLLSPFTRPLLYQVVDGDDSLLGRRGPRGDQRGPLLGLKADYGDLIRKAFHPRYWAGPPLALTKTSSGRVTTAGRGQDGYTQMEHNFSLFFGVSLMLYQATLISDESPFDTARPCLDDPGCDPVTEGLLTQLEVDGFQLFNGAGPVGGQCGICHGGELFSTAAATADERPVLPVIRVPQDDGAGALEPTLHDFGYFNIGTRPAHEDVGVGGLDPYGFPLSFTRQYKRWRQAGRGPDQPLVDLFEVDPCDFAQAFTVPFDPDDCTYEPVGPLVELERVKLEGSFKTPGLRNVALTPPYFHYGGYASLEEVVEFYVHGGNRRDARLLDPSFLGDDSGSGRLGEEGAPHAGPDFGRNTDDNVLPLDLRLPGRDQRYGIDAIVAFMKTLTDRRVQCDQAPFDHPSLPIPVGHAERDWDRDGRADDVIYVLPAVGASGYPIDSGLCIPNTGDLFAPGMQARVGGPPSMPRQFDD